MPFILVYILKLSITLAVVFLFYHFILRKLTFYNHNRWYLLGYSLFAFFIPLVNISPALHRNELAESHVIQWIPVLYQSSTGHSAWYELGFWNIIALLIVGGMIIMLFRLLLQLFSFRKMMNKATLIVSQEVNIYSVEGKVIPFSFGNAVFINPQLHTPEELEEIIRHEFVHVKQLHSLDILFGELLCLLNWYNPFAWFIRSAIRQNLEFIADSKVLEKGTNKKQYQYLLLKVIGNNQFSIAPKFNFSSLKKRIAMMNKIPSNKKHLFRFLFLVPVIAFVLLSFRKEIGRTFSDQQNPVAPSPATDTIPHPSTLNTKGYQITVKDNKGNCLLVIKDKKGNEVKRLMLEDWNKDTSLYLSKYGEIPPPPPPLPADAPAPVAPVEVTGSPLAPPPPAAPSATDLPKNVTSVQVNNNTITVKLKNGQVERYDKQIDGDMKTFESRYGKILPETPAPPPPPAKAAEVKEVTGVKMVTGLDRKLPDNILYVLDGVITDKETINSLDPSRIESVDVLKGPAAEAAFGEKGKNGVIKITTKKTTSQTGLENLFFIRKDDGC